MRYQQQVLFGDRRTGFKNGDDEKWIVYETEPHGAVLNFDKGGHYPKPEWKKIHG